MKVLVTGASGFIGLNIMEALKNSAHEGFALVRSTSRTDFLKNLCDDKHILTGDILDSASLMQHTRGMDAVIHCAGATSGHKWDRESVFKINVTGTENVVQAALQNKVKRLVYTSTTSTIGTTHDTKRADESVVLNGFRKKSQYGQSKTAAEKIVTGAGKSNLEVIILNPAEVLGKFDYHFGWGVAIIWLCQGQLPFFPTGGASFCHAAEVGRAHVNALERGRSGERYILAGTDIKLPVFFDTICRLIDKKLPQADYIKSNYWTLNMFFGLQRFIYPFTKKKPAIDKNRLKMFYSDIYFDSAKAERELDFKTRPVEEMIKASYDWYKDNKVL